MQKHDISNDLRLQCLDSKLSQSSLKCHVWRGSYFSRSSSEPIQHTSTHKATIALGSGSPNGAAKAYQRRCEQDRPSSERRAQRNPSPTRQLSHGKPIAIKNRTHQMKLLNPNTKIATPVNCTTSVKFDSNSTISSGNMGANASGPIPWMNVTAVAQVMVENFQKRFQFSGS